MRKKIKTLKNAAQALAFALAPAVGFSQCDLFFSEYLEGASNNKAIEVYNPTSMPINLTNYKIYRYNNGSPVPTDSLQLVGNLAPGGVYVAGNPSAIAAILAVSDTLHTITFFNGDDAMELRYMPTNTTLDIIGIIGVDPGTNWVVGAGATSEFTLVRNISIAHGNTNWATAVSEWDVYPQNTTSFLGVHTSNGCCAASTATISMTSCNVYTSPSGQIWTTSGTYMDTISNVSGCDSVITINLTINNSSSNTILATVCDSYTSPSGQVWTMSGMYMDTIANMVGCDSVITVNLTVTNSSFNTISATVCDSYTSPSGQVLMTSGTYMDTISNVSGCDSVITINLTVDNSSSSTISTSACYSYTSPSGLVWTMSGTYMDTIPNIMGCDSVITINLTIDTVDVSITSVIPTFTANATNASYIWVDCDNNYAAIPGETNQSFTAVGNGNYGVIITQNGCVDTSECTSIFASVSELTFDNHFNIYPNPTTGEFQLDLGAYYNENLSIEIRNAIGQVVDSKTVVSSNKIVLNIEGSAGIYFVEIQNEEGKTACIKVMKE